MKRPEICIFGEVLFDMFPDGSQVLGGAPFNVAWHLQAFGARPLLVSRVGDDALGRRIRDTMAQWGMRTAGLQQDSAHPTGEVVVTLDHGQPSFDIVPDRAFDFVQTDALPPMDPAMIYHGSLALRRAESARALDELRRVHPAPAFIDVNLRPPWWDRGRVLPLLDAARWVKINDIELDALEDRGGDLESRADRLRRRHGLEWLIVTLGAQGAMAVGENGEVSRVAPAAAATEVVDTVGAGDAFASVVLLGLLREWPRPMILERAQAFAARLVGRRGATVQDPAFYRPLVEQWGLET